nr:MAG TPA: hypothetical protein [Caudoviricetes sp.]
MTCHMSINWAIGYKSYPVENQFPHLGKMV